MVAKLSTLSRALLFAGAVALTPVFAFAQTPAAPATPANKADVATKPAVKADVKPEVKADAAKPAATTEMKSETKGDAAKPVVATKTKAHVHSKKAAPKLEPTAAKSTTPAAPTTPKS